MADTEPGYPKLARNTVVRRKPRGKYDYQTIHSIVNACPVLHVSFPTPDPEEPFPAVLPMLGIMASYATRNAAPSEPLDLYIHGYISSRLMRLGGSPDSYEEGLPLTVAATHLDGFVLALTPNNHSYNYRSAILHGFATPVTDMAEKLWAMEHITNSVVTERWQNTRIPPTKTELTSTQVLKVKIVDASAKIRSGWPSDDRADMKDEDLRAKTWVGVVPSWTSFGEPMPSPENRVGGVPEYLRDFLKEENKTGKKNAEAAAQGLALGY